MPKNRIFNGFPPSIIRMESENNKLTKMNVFVQKMQKWFLKWFVRDFSITNSQIINLTIRALILVTLITFWTADVLNETPEEFQYPLLIVGTLSLLFGGIITDSLLQIKYIFEFLAIFGIFSILLDVYLIQSDLLKVVVRFGLAIINGFLIVLFFTIMLRKTNLLNRARVSTFLLLVMGIACAPLITLIIVIDDGRWVLIITSILLVISLLNVRKYGDQYRGVDIKHIEKRSWSNYWDVLSESGAIPYFFFFLLISYSLGFFLSSAVYDSISTDDIVTLIIAGIISFPLISVLLDNIGRKPIVFLALLLMGIYSIFFDYPDNTVFDWEIFRFSLFAFITLITLILAVVISGDLSSKFSRGKVTGTIIFAVIIGTVLGSLLRISFNSESFNFDSKIIHVSDWSSVILFASVFVMAQAKEPFKKHTRNWRLYLGRLYIISKNGTALYSHDFRDADPSTLNEDLVSGGLTGLQAMLKEISASKQKIKVVDHGDMQIIFHYGKYSTAVLFAKLDMAILMEKLAGFHLQFEYLNENRLEHFMGDVGNFTGLEDLKKQYFE